MPKRRYTAPIVIASGALAVAGLLVVLVLLLPIATLFEIAARVPFVLAIPALAGILVGWVAWALLTTIELRSETLSPEVAGCPSCGRMLREDWRLCPYCGRVMDAPVEQVPCASSGYQTVEP